MFAVFHGNLYIADHGFQYLQFCPLPVTGIDNIPWSRRCIGILHILVENLSALLSALKTDIDSGSEKESAGTEEIIVFSPGATSFGMFRNEFDRGNTFMAEVKKTFI